MIKKIQVHLSLKYTTFKPKHRCLMFFFVLILGQMMSTQAIVQTHMAVIPVCRMYIQQIKFFSHEKHSGTPSEILLYKAETRDSL